MIKRTTKSKSTKRATLTRPEPVGTEAQVIAAQPSEPVKSSPAQPTQPPQPKAHLELVSPNAKSVCVAGSFNGWNPSKTPLTRINDGKWVGDLSGITGRHEYLFVVDGQWIPDPNAKESVQNPFGGRNSVLTVSE